MHTKGANVVTWAVNYYAPSSAFAVLLVVFAITHLTGKMMEIWRKTVRIITVHCDSNNVLSQWKTVDNGNNISK